jgi:hypothetical protein
MGQGGFFEVGSMRSQQIFEIQAQHANDVDKI